MGNSQYVFTLNRLSKSFSGGKTIFKDVTLSFIRGAKIGILGVNGAGKSSLLRIMAGVDNQFTGEAYAAPGVKIGYLEQEPKLDTTKTVFDNIIDGVREIKEALDSFQKISIQLASVTNFEDMDSLIEKQAALQEVIDLHDAWNLQQRIDIAMDALRCPNGDSSVTSLSGGEKRRVALCRLLLSDPDMLLLDEPTNHLDSSSIFWLQRFLAEYKGTVVMVTHDRYFLDNVTNWILEIDHGYGYPFHGNYTEFLNNKRIRLQQKGKQQESLRKMLEREYTWITSSAKARQKKSKARITAYYELLEQVKEVNSDVQQIFIPSGPRLGDLVIDAIDISKSYSGKVLFKNLNFKIPAGAIVGIIGENGSGKTSLLRLITNQDQPDSGVIRIGESVKMVYVNQSRDLLNPNLTVWQEISDGLDMIVIGKKTIPSRTYVANFNFKGSDQQKQVGQLSGGERNRVHLAKMFKEHGNVLILDEPTNDLDLDTLRALEVALEDFPGCAIIVSHDRWFLDRISTHILSFEENQQIVFFEGNYSSYNEDYQKRKASDSVISSTMRYKKIKRN